MSNLRNKVIRLAHQNPDLRPHLLPLLKEASKGQAKAVIQSILRSLDLNGVEAQNLSAWNNKDGVQTHILDLEDYVDVVRNESQWQAFLESQYKTEFKKAYKLLSDAYSRDNIRAFQETFPRSKFFQNVGSPKTSKYALAIVKTMKEILRRHTNWEFGVVFSDFVTHWQGDDAGRTALVQSSGFRTDVMWLTAEKNYESLLWEETQSYLRSL
jgi:hypothetical protein